MATTVVTRAPSNARMSWRHKMKTERRITAEFMERMKTATIMEPHRTPDLDRQPPVKTADAAEDSRFRGPGGINGTRHGRERPRVSAHASRSQDQVNITSYFHRRCGATESGEEDATGAAVKRRRSRSPDRRGNGDECRESIMATEMFRGGCVPQNAEASGHHQGGHDGDDGDGGHDDGDDHDDGDHDDGGAHDNGADYDDDGNRDNDVDDGNRDQGDDCNRDSGNSDDGRGDDGDDDPVHDADALDDGPIAVPPTMPMKPVTAEPPAAMTPSILIVMNRRRTQPAGSAEPPYAPVARVPTAASPITMAQLTTAIRRRPRRAIGDPNSDIVDEAAQRRKRPRHDAALGGADGGPSGSVFVLPRPALEHCNDLTASPTTSRLDDLHDRRRPSAAPTKTLGGPALVAAIVGGADLPALPTPQLPRAVRGRQRRGRARGADALARPNVSNADATSTGTPTTHPSAGSSRSADPAPAPAPVGAHARAHTPLHASTPPFLPSVMATLREVDCGTPTFGSSSVGAQNVQANHSHQGTLCPKPMTKHRHHEQTPTRLTNTINNKFLNPNSVVISIKNSSH